jgi:hypothetical protein
MSWFEQLKLHRSLRLLLYDHRSVSHAPTGHQIAMRTLTRSQPRSLLSIARSNSARSRSRRSRSSMNRISQISFFSGRLAPSFLPAFQAGPCSTGSYDECPIVVLRWPELACGEATQSSTFWPIAESPFMQLSTPAIRLSSILLWRSVADRLVSTPNRGKCCEPLCRRRFASPWLAETQN